MPRCPICETEIELGAIETAPVDEYVDAWLCPNCDAILGMGEIRGERD